MIIDISDPEITKAYQSITEDRSKDWLILSYSKARDALRLVDSGPGGLEIAREHVKVQSSDVNFSLIRVNESGSLVLVCFIPQAVGGVKRARAIVHTRALEDVFPARRAVVNVASETELTSTLVDNALRSRVAVPETRFPTQIQRPMSPPHSSEEGRVGFNVAPRVSSSSSTLTRERELPLNLAQPLDSERSQELANQNIKATDDLAPTSGGIAPERSKASVRNGKPQLSVSVPPRKEKGLRPVGHDGFGRGSYEFDASEDDEDDGDQDDSDEDDRQKDLNEGDENIVVRLNSRPSSRGATPPAGPSILRHPSPIPTKIEHGSSVATSLGTCAHIRFTGPPKDHPHPDHHPLKPTDIIITDMHPASRPGIEGLPSTNQASSVGTSMTISELPSSSSTVFQRSTIALSEPLGKTLPQVYPIQDLPVNTSNTSTSSDQSKHPQATAVASSLLPSSITWASTSQPGPSIPPSDSINYPPPPDSERAGQMPPPRLPSVQESFGPSFERTLPQLSQGPVSAISSSSLGAFSPGTSSLRTHSRNTSISTTGQTHVPSGTLSAFGRRPSVSNNQQGVNMNAVSNSATRLQLENMSPSALMERSSTTNTATTSSSSPSLRSFTIQTQGMTEAQAQAARFRAKWAAEEQGITLAPPPAPIPSLPRSPPLTPPISPPRSLNVDEAGRVRRDGVEKMRREAERRREEDEKKRLAEQQRQSEVEQQLKLAEERKKKETKDRVAQEERRRAADLQRKVIEEELGKRRVEERIRAREKFAEAKGTDKVFLTGHINIQVQNSTTWRRRFYELTADGRLRLYKSSDAPDRVKPSDVILLQGACSIDRNVDELELIPPDPWLVIIVHPKPPPSLVFKQPLPAKKNIFFFLFISDIFFNGVCGCSENDVSAIVAIVIPSPKPCGEHRVESGRSPLKRASLIPVPRPSTPQRSPLTPSAPIPIPFSPDSAMSTPVNKTRRSSSFDKLTATIAGDSMIPVRVTTPGRRTSSPALNGTGHGNTSLDAGAIPEGVPMGFSPVSPTHGGPRSLSPTRTLSRIPVSSVGHARTLADDGQRQQQRAPSPTTPVGDASLHGDASFRSSSLLSPLPSTSGATSTPTSPSAGYRRSLVGGGTTKVLADLQAHTLQVKSVLENTKSQLRSSQRTIAQLTRQTEDLKDGRERLRIENESLNNVVARKERLLQEAARKAEAEVQALKAQLKDETSASKKSMKEMHTTLSQAKAVAQRSEREYVQLRDTLSTMREGWRKEVETLRDQMRGSQNEAQEALSKQIMLLKLLEDQKVERENMDKLHAEYRAVQDEFTKQFRSELAAALATVEKSARDCDSADRTAKDVADELARLQRLIKAGPTLEESGQ
ncbi:hypothetical protein RHS04_05952 [Rhizoctonia solani]|uniref:ADF-H domain-containing protein n=1 Tax=Rhizoctonia solani TaxID=456999 RepID=A0A8H7H4U2_9AGAM|nr:hypothetical protein RHS04_05952 [Rhizoctonia solani]